MVASLGDQPQDVLRGAADEVLAWLKVRELCWMCDSAQASFRASDAVYLLLLLL